jgi:hypothetical protein
MTGEHMGGDEVEAGPDVGRERLLGIQAILFQDERDLNT